MSLPAIRAVRARFPDADLAVLSKPAVAALYESESCIDRVIPLPGRAGARDWGAKWRAIKRLRREHFDLAVLLPNSFESAAVVRLAGVKRVVGYNRDGRGWLLHSAIPVPQAGEIPQHEVFYYLELLRRAGLADALPEMPEIRLDDIEKARRNGRELFGLLEVKLPVVGISPGAAYGTAKRWLPERFAEAAKEMAAQLGGSIAVFGSAAEKDLCEQVAQACGGRNFAGTTALRAFIDMTAACSLFLTNDSGAMHVAAALGVPSVTVFGPTNEFATGPAGPLARIVREPVECAPCMKRECPISSPVVHPCMTNVTAARVVSVARELLETGPDLHK